MEAFRQEVKLTPKDPFAYYNLGVACHRAGETKNAIEAYKKALELTPDDKPTHWQLAHAYERAGLWNLANAEWNAVLKLTPTPEEKATAEKHLKENEGK
jgi:Flp pilus assembly protein TadD